MDGTGYRTYLDRHLSGAGAYQPLELKKPEDLAEWHNRLIKDEDIAGYSTFQVPVDYAGPLMGRDELSGIEFHVKKRISKTGEVGDRLKEVTDIRELCVNRSPVTYFGDIRKIPDWTVPKTIDELLPEQRCFGLADAFSLANAQRVVPWFQKLKSEGYTHITGVDPLKPDDRVFTRDGRQVWPLPAPEPQSAPSSAPKPRI